MHIGLSQRILYHKQRAYDSIEHGWYSYLKDHTLTFVTNTVDQDFNKLAQELDAFIITGGDDSAVRRTVELKLATAMIKQFKPVVGVCHGCFLLTDVMGGIVEEVADHMDTDHTVRYFNQEFRVNSYHSLAIAEPHKTARVLAVDNSGRCEAWIDGNIAGVVWHPERMSMPWLPSEIQNLLKV